MAGIRKKFSFQLLYALSQILFPLLTYPYITRTIGAEGLGKIGYVEYVAGFITTIAAFGIPFYGVREVAKLQNQPQKAGQLFRQVFSIQLLLSGIGVIVFWIVIKVSNQPISSSLLALGCITILLPPFVAEWYMQGIEAFRFTTVRSIILRLSGVLAMFLFVASPEDYTSYYLIIVLIQAAVAFSNLYKIGYKNLGVDSVGYQQHAKPLWHFFLTASVISVYVFFDVIILGWFTSQEVVGHYTLAIKLVKLSLLVVLSLNVILFPRISNLKTADDDITIRMLLQKSLDFMLFITLPIAAGFYFLSGEIIELIAGNGFTGSVSLVRALSCLPLVIGLSSLFVYQVLIPFGKEKKLLQAVIITCCSSLVLQIGLSKYYSAEGTAVATTLTEFIMLLLTGIYARQTFPFALPLRTFFQTIMALLPFAGCVFLSRHLSNDALVVMGAGLIPGMVLYAIVQRVVFKNAVIKEAISYLGFGKKSIAVHG